MPGIIAPVLARTISTTHSGPPLVISCLKKALRSGREQAVPAFCLPVNLMHFLEVFVPAYCDIRTSGMLDLNSLASACGWALDCTEVSSLTDAAHAHRRCGRKL